MAYYCLTQEAARKAYEALSESITPNWSALRQVKGAGEPNEYDEVKKIVDGIRDEFESPLTDGDAARFEGRVGVALHENIVDQAAVVDPDFWRWVALDLLREATLDRHYEKHDKMPNERNFGIGSRVECFPYRAWLRADIGYDPAASPAQRYRLALRGDQDLWRSHLIRVRHAYHRDMAHSLIEFQYPSDESDGVLKKGDKNEGIRVLAKKLARMHANMVFPLLPKEKCRWLIMELAEGLERVDGSRYSRNGGPSS